MKFEIFNGLSASRIILLVWCLLSLSMVPMIDARAQDKSDVIFMTNGDKKEGKVVGVGQTTIKFRYKGEDLEYELNKSEIDHVVFASGRTESYNTQASAPQPAGNTPVTTTAAERRGKLAIIPFEINTNDQGLMVDKMGKEMQSDCINAFKQYTHGVTVIDAHTVNTILAQNNITPDKYDSYAPKDLALMLGVQYVVLGNTEIMNKGTSSYGSGVSTYKDKDSQSKDGNKKSEKSSGTAVTSTSSSTTIEYGTKCAMEIFDDTGSSVFSQKRDTFGTGLDAYLGSIDYMTKRTPFGSKAKN